MQVISRAAWGAAPPRTRTSIPGPVRGVAKHWNGPGLRIRSHAECYTAVRGTQRYHMQVNGWADIAYNHLICPHGTIFEGRGWGTRSAANGTNYGNAHYHAAMHLIGVGDAFTDEGKRGGRALVDAHRARYGGEVTVHSRFKSTTCPGDAIRAWVAAGCPAAGAPPAPDPSPSPGPMGSVIDSEDDDMFTLLRGLDGRVYLVAFGVFGEHGRGYRYHFRNPTQLAAVTRLLTAGHPRPWLNPSRVLTVNQAELDAISIEKPRPHTWDLFWPK